MPLYQTISIPEGIIGIWQLVEKPEDLQELLSGEELLNPDFTKYTYDKRKVEWLAIRIMLRTLIGPAFRIEYTESGKPLISHSQYKHIAISHSRDFAVFIIHENRNVGIDIECISRNYNSIERRYLSESESKYINKNQVLQCIYWCAKEAIFKLVPDDGIEFRTQIQIKPFDPVKEKQFITSYSNPANCWHYHVHFQILEENCLVWVLDEPIDENNIR